MKTNEQVIVEYNGIALVGEITHRTPMDIAVKMVSPYKGKKDHRHISAMAGMHTAHKYGKDLFMGYYGDKRAKEMLVDIYEKNKKE